RQQHRSRGQRTSRWGGLGVRRSQVAIFNCYSLSEMRRKTSAAFFYAPQAFKVRKKISSMLPCSQPNADQLVAVSLTNNASNGLKQAKAPHAKRTPRASAIFVIRVKKPT